MTLRIRDDGHYFVKLTAETIPTDIELRIQVRAFDISCLDRLGKKVATAWLGKPRPKWVVTLPPIRFEPPVDQLDRGKNISWRWEQEGYSHHLHELMQQYRSRLEKAPAKPATDVKPPNQENGQGPWQETELAFDRIGTVQVGSVPKPISY
jgi:hypothetical protein